MIEATRNQLANVGNPFQGDARKVLCVCSAGLLRSPTLANVLHSELGYNTRACGSAFDFALIPITEALIYWADEIVFVDESCKVYIDKETQEHIDNASAKTYTLNVPDQYNYDDLQLRQIVLEQYLSEA